MSTAQRFFPPKRSSTHEKENFGLGLLALDIWPSALCWTKFYDHQRLTDPEKTHLRKAFRSFNSGYHSDSCSISHGDTKNISPLKES